MTAHVGSEQLVNTRVVGDVFTSHVASLQNGGYVVVWASRDTGGEFDLEAQRFDNAGQALGSEFTIRSGVPGMTAGHDVLAGDIIGLANGDFVVAEVLSFFNLLGPQARTTVVRYHSDGTQASNGTVGGSNGAEAAVARVGSGSGYAVVSTTYTMPADPNRTASIDAAIYDASDHAVGAATVTSVANSHSLDADTLTNGNFVVSWIDGAASQTGATSHTHAKVFGTTGSLISDDIDVGLATDAATTRVVGLSNGNFAVVWVEQGGTTDTDGTSIHGRVYSASGAALTSDFTINSTTAGNQNQPDVTALSDGTFYVTWAGPRQSGTSIFGQIIDSAGNHVGNEVVVNAQTPGNHSSPSAATLASGQLVDVYTDNSHLIVNPNTGQTDPDTGIVSQMLDVTVQDPPIPKFALPVNWTSADPLPGSGTWTVGDFNGDHKDDIFRSVAGAGVDVFLSNGASFSDNGTWSPAGLGTDDHGSPAPFVIGDFNGDGKDDIFRYVTGTGVDMFLSNGASFAHTGVWSGAGIGSDNHWYAGDFNGDGKDDIFRYIAGQGVDVLFSTGTSFNDGGVRSGAGIGSDNQWYVGDFNGDHHADIFRYIAGQGVDVLLWNGTTFTEAGIWTPAGAGVDTQGNPAPWSVGDFNGDGRADILRYLPGTVGADVFLSSGTSFVRVGSWTPAGQGSDNRWHVGDFDGDGTGDLLREIAGHGVDVLI